MFPPDGDVRESSGSYYLKAMNCPMHNLIFTVARAVVPGAAAAAASSSARCTATRSPGVLHGLTRVRGLTQDDSHSYVTPEQAPDEIRHLLNFVLGLLRDFGLEDFYLELSTRGDPDKFIGSDEQWDEATRILKDAAESSGLELVPDPGGAAFYGPKISVQARDAIGRTWQLSTVQYDFNQPERFGLEYTAADGSRQQPVMIHSAKFGSIERFFGVLTEHYAGAFPPWLAPVQVVGVPVAEAYADYLEGVAERLRREGIRVEVDTSDDRMQKKIRNAQQAEGAVRADRGGGGRRQGRGVVPVPRRLAGQRRARRRGGRPHRRGRPLARAGLTPLPRPLRAPLATIKEDLGGSSGHQSSA